MPFSVTRLIKSSLELIKLDYFIFLPTIILFFFLQIITSFFKIKEITPEALESNQGTIIILLGFIAILQTLIQLLVVAMGKDLRDKKEINFSQAIIISIKKLPSIFFATILLIMPIGVIMFFMPKIKLLLFISTVITFCFVVIIMLLPIISIFDDLSMIKTIKKTFLFIKINLRSFISFSLHFLGLLFSFFILNSLLVLIPTIGETILFPISQGIVSVVLIFFTLVYYIEYNERRC
jgi:hypothetical protein